MRIAMLFSSAFFPSFYFSGGFFFGRAAQVGV